MINDKSATELVSKSLRTDLNESEAKEIEEHLLANEETLRFAKLSTAIQDSVADLAAYAERGDEAVAPGLSVAAKERLNGSVKMALAEKLQRTQGSGPERQSPVSGRSSMFGAASNEAGDVRQVNSRFTLLRQLGEGGLGGVWLARDEKLRRNVAIKQMNAESMESPKNWQRFHREAEITGHLEHPNIVPLYQFGIDSKTNEPFYAMRFVGKRTLADAIVEYHERRLAGEADELGLHRLLSSFQDVCQAIAYAHSRGVIHRDLKPENVALDNFGQVIVLDWGLAKLAEDGELSTQLSDDVNIGDEVLAQTIAGEVIGTPLYMAPEQAAGDLDNIDESTDVYGLGAILFAILTGSAPHQNSVNREAEGESFDFRAVLKSIVEKETPRPRDLVPSVPRELQEVCVKAMSKKRYSRFESASELAGLIERWLAGQSQKQSRYETMRMEGRELRADLQSAVRDLETNVRFMLRLPPIQELIRAEANEENVLAWRERLATIFKGLLSANGDYQNVIYCRVEDDKFREIVRVERHSTEHSVIRSIPKSRLKTRDVNDYIQQVIDQNPEEVLSSLVCDPMCDKSSCDRVRLVAGVPVYDEKSEEVFGVVMIDCDLERVFQKQMNRRLTACEVIVACDTHHIMMHNKEHMMLEESIGQPVTDVVPKFENAVEALQTQGEYIDECDREIYGARLWLIPRVHGLYYLLSVKE